jgi:hypothetical protein
MRAPPRLSLPRPVLRTSVIKDDELCRVVCRREADAVPLCPADGVTCFRPLPQDLLVSGQVNQDRREGLADEARDPFARLGLKVVD